MKDLKVLDVINLLDGKLIYGNLDDVLNKFCKDSYNCTDGDTFIGIKGIHFDGNLFYKEAFSLGAKTAIVEEGSFKDNNFEHFENKNLILVKDTLKALVALSTYKRSLYNIPVIAVTGSVGKTSTKDMIASVLSKKYKVLKTKENFNNHIGLPLTILSLKDEEVMVLEMGMNKFGEIDKLTRIARPTIGVITNIGTAHIGILGSRENILKAKLEIINGMTKDNLLLLNNDNDILNKYISDIKENINVKTFGIYNNSDFKASVIRKDAFSSIFTINNKEYTVNVGGEAFIYNSLASYCIGKELGLSDEEIKSGLEEFKLSSNRLDKTTNQRGTTIINDTYNASYDSVINAIELLNKCDYKRKIFVFGDILELGIYSEEIHKKIADSFINSNIDIIVLVGDNIKYTYKELLNKGFNKNNIYVFSKENETYELLDKLLTKDDIILLKGSHSMNLINIVNIIKNY